MTDILEYFLTSIFDMSWILQLLIIALSWVMLCRGVAETKQEWLRNTLELSVLLVILVGCDMAVLLIPGAPFMLLWNIIHGVVGAVYLMLRSECHNKAKFIIWCSMFAGMWCLTAIAGWCSYLIGIYVAKGVAEAVVRGCVYALMIPLAFFLRAFNFNDYKTVPPGGMVLILTGDVSLLILSVAEIPWVNSDYSPAVVPVLLIANASMLVVLMLVVYAIYSMCKDKAEILSLQVESQRLQSEREAAELVEENLKDLRCIRHDLKNQYAYCQILLESGRYDEALGYFRQLSENLPAQLNYVDCGNYSMNTILNMEIAKAKREHITVEHQLVVPPVLPFNDDDLCAILANLMDNAIEECIRLRKKGIGDPLVRIEINPYMNYLYIMCANTTDRETLRLWKGGLRTTKDDDQLHGYGTQIVGKLAQKYDGHVEYKLKEGRFVAQVLLDMMKEKE